ncbi:hypothetical protein ACFPM7_10540 [Actinokineospora guangxiensis]|uniref:Uncharacterized protein n=1 Tax=Actinokineospora guangxiensis TaxID=1490288 RepID=A0ABW0EMF2_9PSEU
MGTRRRTGRPGALDAVSGRELGAAFAQYLAASGAGVVGDVDGGVVERIRTRGGAASPWVGQDAATVSTPAAAASDSMSATGRARFRNHVRR